MGRRGCVVAVDRRGCAYRRGLGGGWAGPIATLPGGLRRHARWSKQQPWAPATHHQSGDSSPGHHQRIGQPHHGQGQKGRSGDAKQHGRVEGPAAHPPGGHQHDRQHRRFEHGKHHRQQWQMAPEGVASCQGREHQNRGRQKQSTGDQPAPGAMHEPAQVGGQLGGLRPRQQHAVVEGVQVAPLREPAATLHQLPM